MDIRMYRKDRIFNYLTDAVKDILTSDGSWNCKFMNYWIKFIQNHHYFYKSVRFSFCKH